MQAPRPPDVPHQLPEFVAATPHRIATLTGAIVVVAIGFWFYGAFIRDDTPEWRSDGVIVERLVPFGAPRTDVTVVSAGRESFPWAYGPFNSGDGDCHDPRFRIVVMPQRHRIYHDGDALSIQLHYVAPGCTHLSAGFGGRHVKGSPWYEYWCGATSSLTIEKSAVCKDTLSSLLHAHGVALTGAEGTVDLVAEPGAFPPTDVGSAPNLEGFELCTLQLGVNDGRLDGSGSSQQINVDCPNR